MKRLPQTLMALSGLLFLVSLTPQGIAIHYGIIKPLSAILFIVAFILMVLQKEVALYDAEERARISAADAKTQEKEPTEAVRRPTEVTARPLVHAH